MTTTLRLARRHRRVRTWDEGMRYRRDPREVRVYEARVSSYPSSPRVFVMRWSVSGPPIEFGTQADAEAFVKARRCAHVFHEEPDFATLWRPRDRSYGGVFWKPDGGLVLVHPRVVVETRRPGHDLEELLCSVPTRDFAEVVDALTREDEQEERAAS